MNVKTKQSREAPIEAIVIAVIRGEHGPYVIAKADSRKDLGSITFALDDEVWGEENWPREADLVMLSDIRKRPAGWRAYSVCFKRPGQAISSKK